MKTCHPRLILLTGLLVLLLSQSAMSQTAIVNTRDQIVKAVQQAKPGTTILIAPGTYQGGLNFNRLRGEQNKPITLAAADRGLTWSAATMGRSLAVRSAIATQLLGAASRPRAVAETLSSSDAALRTLVEGPSTLVAHRASLLPPECGWLRSQGHHRRRLHVHRIFRSDLFRRRRWSTRPV